MTLNELMNMKLLGDIMIKPMNEQAWCLFADTLLQEDEVYLQYGEKISSELLKTLQKMVDGIIYYSICTTEPYKMIGYVAVAPDDRNYLEYHIFKEYRRKGYATKAVTYFIELFFSGELTGREENELYADVVKENISSVRLLSKLGFEKDDKSKCDNTNLVRYVLKRS